jgi:protein-tyrosine phosphatase
MIDLHCHVLPAVDDGPATVEEAIALARRARADGIDTIAATPHVDWAHPHVDGASVASAIGALQPRLDAAGVGVRLVAGGELDITRAVALDDAELRALSLGGGPWLLLECPLSPMIAHGFADAARALVRRGHRLLLAHPERSPVFLRAPELLDVLVAEGMLAQVTSGSLIGRFGRPARELAARLLERGAIHVAASDAHGEHRPATLGRDLQAAELDPALAAWLTRAVPAALLAGAPVPPRPVPGERAPARRSLRRSLESRWKFTSL